MNELVFRETITVSLPDGMRSELHEAARKRGVLGCELVIEALRRAIDEVVDTTPDEAANYGEVG